MGALKPFTMPKWGIEMTEGTLANWEVEAGKPYAKGDILALIETDKITNEVEAEADGCLVRLIAVEQETYPVGALLGVYGPADSKPSDIDAFIAAFKPANSDDAADQAQADAALDNDHAPAAPRAPTISDDVAISPAARDAAQAAGLAASDIIATGRKGRITKQDVDQALKDAAAPILKGAYPASGQDQAFASPLAKRLAAQNAIALSAVTGTGNKGRITKSDVLALVETAQPPQAAPATTAAPAPQAPAAAPAPAPQAGVEVVKMTAMRKTIARRLTAAKQDIPHIYLRRRVRADRLLHLRERDGKPGTINDYLLRACALALMEVPAVNVQVHGDEIHRFNSADIAVAVATDRGLITPIIQQADSLSVAQIAKAMGGLAQRARAGKLASHEFQGGSFSLSNLGSFGVEEFDAVINPPQGAILAVGKARPEPIDDDGAIRIVPVLHLSLSCDHRAIDGVDGARFLDALANLIETPEQL